MITGVILTHNEQANIVECIKHLRPHVSELFLLDTDSTDQTVELARPLVDRVIMHPHVPNFDSARNIAIPEARYEWLWFVDADEFVPIITGELVNQWIRERGESFEAINIPFKSYFCGQWMQHCGWWPGYTCARVLKRGHFKFSATLHGGVELNGREVRAPANAYVGIEHRSFRDLQHWIEKFNRYTSTESLQLAKRGVMYDWRGALRFMVHDLWEHYEKFEARLDGERGWILTWCAGLYRWMSVAKLIDHGRSEEQMGGASSVPADLDEFVAALQEELACFRKYDPTFPLGIVLRAPVWDATQASQEARQWIRQLAYESRTIVVESLPSESRAALNENELLFLKALENGKRSRSVLTITYWCNCVIVADPCASFNVLRFSDESRFDASQIPLICQYNELWTASESQSMKLRELGASPEQIRFVPYLLPNLDNDNQHAFVGMLVSEIENSLQPVVLSAPVIDQVSVTLEGEFYAGHSFSNINEQLAERFARDPRIALSLSPSNMNQLHGERLRDAHKLRPYFGRQVPSNASIILRHAFPPNWEKPASGVWVHIQPWEFGHLPSDWIDHLRNEVDEIWVMSRYVEQVYISSGVNPDIIRYIPWGVDESIFELEVPKRDLPTKKTFRFLYVGGTILRKGFDRVLEAYLQEFTAEDDVCLIVKDVGTNSFYQPQSMQSDIRQAQGCPTNPQIVYYSEDFSPGQLASLYAACDCIVAPYRGEGFGLPILEAMACGLAPIVPMGGPTDDFVTNETGYFLPTQVISADGVNNLCGPATEFHVSIDDLRSLMRQASTDWETTRSRGLRASQYVRSNFTWVKTARQMTDRFCELRERAVRKQRLLIANHSDNSSILVTGKQDKLRVVAVVSYHDDLPALVESLSRLCPYVDEVYFDGCGQDEQASEVAKEYGANLLLDQVSTFSKSNWILRIDAGYYLKDSDSCKLREWLSNQPYTIQQVYFPYGTSDAAEDYAFMVRTEPSKYIRETLRSLNNVDVRGSENAVESEFQLLHCQWLRPASGKEQEISKAEHVQPTSGRSRSSKHGRLGKSLLIQMASGSHERLLMLTRQHHRQYAMKHQMDYWDVGGVPVTDKRAGWGKVPLILAGIAMGYDHIVWLDADAVVVRTEIDLTGLINKGIGMVRHPNPDHWNTGMIIVRADEQVEEFWRQVDAYPENESAWMEQLAVNNLLSTSQFAGFAVELDLKFNSVPGLIECIDPVIVAGHGLPFASREAIVVDALSRVSTKSRRSNGFQIRRREDFPQALNRLGLVGEAVEVGVCRGEFAEQILQHWNGKMLHLVDPWRQLSNYSDIANLPDNEQEANLQATRSRLSRFRSRVCIHRALSSQAVVFFEDQSLDFVYLDANHSFEAVQQDLRDWYTKVRRGGILAGHDFLDGKLPEGEFGVASAVTRFGSEENLAIELTDDPPWRSWFVLKK